MVSADKHNETVFNEVSFSAFGTAVALKARSDEPHWRHVLGAARADCRCYERLFSAFDPFSDIGRINRSCGRWVPIASDTFDLLEASIGYCRASQGLFDITAKPLVDLWDVHRGIVPLEDAVQEALGHVDYRTLQLERDGSCCLARLRDARAALDLGGIAKGWVSDRLCDTLARAGLRNFIVNLGGSVAARGCRIDGSPFVAAIRDPNNHRGFIGSAALRDCAAVASGLTERFFTEGGCTYSHIIDVSTGRPVRTDVQSVTVIGRRGIDCDGFSTTLCALGMEEGPVFAQGIGCIDGALFVGADGRVVAVGDAFA